MKSKSESKNLLDFIPVRNNQIEWKVEQDELVVFYIQNKGIYNRIAQTLFKKPEVSRLSLDELGSFVWKQIDGKCSIYQIAQSLKEEFGDKAEPLYDRLATYVLMLKKYNLIRWNTMS